MESAELDVTIQKLNRSFCRRYPAEVAVEFLNGDI